MSAQRLSDRSRRRIERSTGLAIVRAWAHGGYVFDFVTVDHRHGSWDKRTGEWQLDDDPTHYSSCRELFPESVADLVAAREAPVVEAAAERAAQFGAAWEQVMRAAVAATVMQSSE
ncbi:hypothetical protein SEA_RUTHIEJR_44 [Mycobacterium phage Ruthiejr]|nr:hypothetical protein SEA_RUTHIEJR_44 [Mycobacterium phage Ruthiejr]